MLFLQQDVVALLFPYRKIMCTLKLLDVHKMATVIAASHDFLAQKGGAKLKKKRKRKENQA